MSDQADREHHERLRVQCVAITAIRHRLYPVLGRVLPGIRLSDVGFDVLVRQAPDRSLVLQITITAGKWSYVFSQLAYEAPPSISELFWDKTRSPVPDARQVAGLIQVLVAVSEEAIRQSMGNGRG